MFKQTLVLSALSLSFSVFLVAASRVAAASGGITVEPAYQQVTLSATQATQSAIVSLTNHEANPLDFELFALDFRQTDHFGSLAFIEGLDENYPHSLAPYITFTQDRVSISPGATVPVAFQITDKPTLSPGGHYAAIIARAVSVSSATQPVVPALSSLILVTKTGGERYHLSLTNLDWSPSVTLGIPEKITATFQNQGNTHTTPRGNAELSDMFGRVVSSGIVNENSLHILPGTPRRIPIQLRKKAWLPPATVLTLSISGGSDQGNTHYVHQDTVLYINPWFLGFAGFLTLSLSGFWHARTRSS